MLWVALWLEVLGKAGTPVGVSLGGAFLLGTVCSFLSTARPAFRQWLSFAAPAPLVFVLVFLLLTPVSGLVLPSKGEAVRKVHIADPAPVVMIVFDEFPLASLLASDGNIDPGLFPNLAALQAHSNTYLNATSNSARTPYSVPSILTGQLPDGRDVPTATTHPDSLFSLLGGSYDLRVHELLSMCSQSLCPTGSRGALAGLGPLVADGVITLSDIVDPRDPKVVPGAELGDAVSAMRERDGRSKARRHGSALLLPARYADFLDDLDRAPVHDRPVLGFFHILLPHAPWLLTPSGQKYSEPGDLPSDLNMAGEVTWPTDGRFVNLARQRHLLQVQYVDRMVGELVERLKSSGLWDKALVVITADHGVSFTPGTPRREPTRSNISQIAWVPLFMKLPGQTIGNSSMVNAQLIDVLPTIADVLGVRPWWRVDGHSLLGDPRPEGQRRPFLAEPGHLWHLDGTRLRRQLPQRSVASFAPGGDDPLRIFRAGEGADLVGKSTVALGVGPAVKGWAHVDRSARWSSVDTSAANLPVYLTGSLQGAPSGVSRLAVSINGVVAGVSALTEGPGSPRFAVLVPPALLRDGKNSLGVSALDGRNRLTPFLLR